MAFTNERENTTLVDKLVSTRRVAKTVKGGRNMSVTALIVVGDENGKVGFGSGKAKEMPDALRKATEDAKRGMIKVPLRDGRTIHHEIIARFGAAQVMLRPAPAGTGIIAGGPMRSVFEVLGIKDIVAKSQGSNNPYNMVRATFEALKGIETPRAIAQKRGIRMSELRKNRALAGFVEESTETENTAVAE